MDGERPGSFTLIVVLLLLITFFGIAALGVHKLVGIKAQCEARGGALIDRGNLCIDKGVLR